MSWLFSAVLLVSLAVTFGQNRPAVRVLVTQKGLDYAIHSAVEYAKTQMANQALPDIKGKVTKFFDVNFELKSMTIYNMNITHKSLRSVPKKGLYIVVRDVDFDVKGKWKLAVAGFFSNFGTFDVVLQGMAVGVRIDLDVKGGHLVVSRVTCASKVEKIDIVLKSGQATSFLFPLIKRTMNSFAKSHIPSMVCKETKKAIKKNLNEQFAKFPVKQHLERSVTLDYSIVEKPKYGIDAVSLFLKGELQPTDGHMTWTHQPAALPSEHSRERMMYVTMMDHMLNSAAHAYYYQNAMQVNITLKQSPDGSMEWLQSLSLQITKLMFPLSQSRSAPRLPPKTNVFVSYVSRISTGLRLLPQSICSTCDVHISLAVMSPPQIRTTHSGIHFNIHAMAKVTVILPQNIKEWMIIETNISATAVPRLSGTNLSTNITNLNIKTRLGNQSVLSVLWGRAEEMKNLVKQQIEKNLENGISAMEIPLPLSEKFRLVKPFIAYGQGYITLETDIQVI